MNSVVVNELITARNLLDAVNIKNGINQIDALLANPVIVKEKDGLPVIVDFSEYLEEGIIPVIKSDTPEEIKRFLNAQLTEEINTVLRLNCGVWIDSYIDDRLELIETMRSDESIKKAVKLINWDRKLELMKNALPYDKEELKKLDIDNVPDEYNDFFYYCQPGITVLYWLRDVKLVKAKVPKNKLLKEKMLGIKDTYLDEVTSNDKLNIVFNTQDDNVFMVMNTIYGYKGVIQLDPYHLYRTKI